MFNNHFSKNTEIIKILQRKLLLWAETCSVRGHKILYVGLITSLAQSLRHRANIGWYEVMTRPKSFHRQNVNA